MSQPNVGGRPTKAQSDANFEDRLERYFRSGLSDQEVANKIGAGRLTVWRYRKALSERTKGFAAEVKKAREYHDQQSDEFMQEPVIKEWIEDMKLRRVKDWKRQVLGIKNMCKDLQIYPDQLVPILDVETNERDFTWAKKWLALKTEVPLDKLRSQKTFFRNFAKKFGATDYELTIAQFDAKHYGVGKWKTVQLDDDKIRLVEAYLSDPMKQEIEGQKEALFAFRFGIETCRPKEPIYSLTADQFYTLPTKDGKTLYCANVFRRKTEKSGAPYKTAYVSKATYDLAKELGAAHGGPVMDSIDPQKTIYPILRAAYVACGIHAADPENPQRDYFDEHPIHSLRHAGAMRLLRLTNYNRAVVAELGGWEAEKTLEDHYGGVPEDVIRSVAGSLL